MDKTVSPHTDVVTPVRRAGAWGGSGEQGCIRCNRLRAAIATQQPMAMPMSPPTIKSPGSARRDRFWNRN